MKLGSFFHKFQALRIFANLPQVQDLAGGRLLHEPGEVPPGPADLPPQPGKLWAAAVVVVVMNCCCRRLDQGWPDLRVEGGGRAAVRHQPLAARRVPPGQHRQPVLRRDHLHRGVLLPPGAHTRAASQPSQRWVKAPIFIRAFSLLKEYTILVLSHLRIY